MDVLANWLWQGSAVAIVATALLRASRRISATTRYQLWWITLAVVLALPLAPLLLSLVVPGVVLQPSAPVGFPDSGGSGVSVVLPVQPVWLVALLAGAWIAWSAVSLSRTAAALATLVRAKRSARPFPASEEVRLRTWRSLQSQGRRARLMISDDVRAAAVLGLGSPAIVVAPRTLGALTDRELDQIVVHEWAHVQRRDDIARLVQRFVVALAGLHPAIWWIDRQLHLERETACDDWAVNAAGSARELAVCLTKLAEFPDRGNDGVLVPAAILSSELTTRVVRLLDRERNTSTRWTPGAPMVVVPMLASLALVVASVELVVTSPAERVALPGMAPVATTAPIDPVAPVTLAPRVEPGGSARLPRGAEGRAPQAVSPGVARIAPAPTERNQVATPAPDQGARRPALAPELPALPGVLPGGPLGAQDLPGTPTPVSPVSEGAPPSRPLQPIAGPGPDEPGGPTVWGAAAGAGVTVGKGSQKAAVATAGFFTRLGKSISGVF